MGIGLPRLKNAMSSSFECSRFRWGAPHPIMWSFILSSLVESAWKSAFSTRFVRGRLRRLCLYFCTHCWTERIHLHPILNCPCIRNRRLPRLVFLFFQFYYTTSNEEKWRCEGEHDRIEYSYEGVATGPSGHVRLWTPFNFCAILYETIQKRRH